MMHANYERERRERLAAYGTTITNVKAYREDEYSTPYMWDVTYLDGEKRTLYRMCDNIPEGVFTAMDEGSKWMEYHRYIDEDGDEVEELIDHYVL